MLRKIKKAVSPISERKLSEEMMRLGSGRHNKPKKNLMQRVQSAVVRREFSRYSVIDDIGRQNNID